MDRSGSTPTDLRQSRLAGARAELRTAGMLGTAGITFLGGAAVWGYNGYLASRHGANILPWDISAAGFATSGIILLGQCASHTFNAIRLAFDEGYTAGLQQKPPLPQAPDAPNDTTVE